jgi:starch phosphorylase
MNVIHEYLSIVDEGLKLDVPKTYIFAGKAAPGYWAAKQIIKLVNNVADVINNDVRVKDMIKVAFIPDYRVSLAQRIFPAADLSEQISTAGKEASGTGNMKFGLNGALTIGTLDGANIEMRELVGPENIFIFGNTAEDLEEMRLNGSYSPRDTYQEYVQVRRIMDSFKTSLFCPVEPNLFNWVFHQLIDHGDTYFHLADLPSYIETHAETRRQYLDRALWAKKAILNVARLGWFSSDRTIRDYARDIWNVEPVR